MFLLSLQYPLGRGDTTGNFEKLVVNGATRLNSWYYIGRYTFTSFWNYVPVYSNSAKLFLRDNKRVVLEVV